MVEILKAKKIILIFFFLAIFAGGFFYFSNKINFSRGAAKQSVFLKIEKGDDAVLIGKKLEQANIVSNYFYFVFYVWKEDLHRKIMAGEYEIAPNLTIPEIARVMTRGEIESTQVKITFPEGWTAKEMESRIKSYELRVDDFSDLIKKPEYFQEKYDYDFLGGLPKSATLEGFLFPDTYYFSKKATAEDVVKKMLDNFGQKLSSELRREIEKQKRSFFEIIIMASIIEGEVKTEEDRKLVSGLFWQRIKNGQALQSCATLAYILGENKKQYSFEDTQVSSPYNTYLNKGLPPGPISNSGLMSIRAAIYPVDSQYNYFLSDPATSKTIFSKTLDEHNANKIKYGL